MPYYVYIVKCSNDAYYTGYTTDLKRRIEEHNSNSKKGAKYTRGKGPVTLKYFEEFDNKSDALKREHTLKRLSHSNKINLIKNHQNI